MTGAGQTSQAAGSGALRNRIQGTFTPLPAQDNRKIHASQIVDQNLKTGQLRKYSETEIALNSSEMSCFPRWSRKKTQHMLTA